MSNEEFLGNEDKKGINTLEAEFDNLYIHDRIYLYIQDVLRAFTL
ncbi:hypothetical protein J2T13_004835 [Paenibacillus sp. DS2015]